MGLILHLLFNSFDLFGIGFVDLDIFNFHVFSPSLMFYFDSRWIINRDFNRDFVSRIVFNVSLQDEIV